MEPYRQRSRIKITSLFFLLAGCGGQNASTSLPEIQAPSNLQASVSQNIVTLTWDHSPDAESYSIYYGREPIDDPANYAAYEGGTWMQDVSSPLTITLDDPSPVYRFIVTAENDVGESEPSNTVFAVVRYNITGPTVIDLVTGLEWMRCSNGQTWNSATDECDGSLVRANYADIQSARPAGWDIPTVEQFQSLGFCDSGPPTAAFQLPGESCDPAGERGVYAPAFPATSFDKESVYITSTVSVAPDLLRSFSFGPAGGSVSLGIPFLSPAVGVYARFVRPPPTP